MKLDFLVFVLVIQQTSCHMRRLSCYTSDVTFVDFLCNMKRVNRTNQLLNIGARLTRNVTDAKMSMLWEYKSYRNWRQIYKSPEIDLCLALVIGSNLPFLKRLFEQGRMIHPMFPTSCPITGPRAEYYYNVPIFNYEPGVIAVSDVGNFQLPNGLYKVRISANSKDDPVGGYIEWINEVNGKFNLDQW